MNIQEIPDFPALQQLGRALWKIGKARGAAILVGAGFTRNADCVHPNTPEPPLWTDIAQVMQERIYPQGTRERKDPLRLAEEFKAVLGEPALESLIREMVRDEEWLPGELHKTLVKLPWTDILTTNWDTLIERAALENLGQTYETVRCLDDIATTRAPRIVKLHGSLPSNRPFILSEEDYRTYPRVFAPFVNLVQQTLLENELCLLGFSGDDPNFLEWSGWVRDQLGASARRIHLVGALNLSLAQRRLLESRNISAIDLTPLVSGQSKVRHSLAAKEFLDYLRREKPAAEWDWPKKQRTMAANPFAQSSSEQTTTQAEETLQDWKAQRLSYPGWALCPPTVRAEERRNTIQSLHLIKRAYELLRPEDRGKLLFEAAWRHETFLLPLQEWLEPLFRQAVTDDRNWEDPTNRELVALLLLRSAREDRDQAAFAEWTAYLKGLSTSDQETISQLKYQQCLWARDELNFRELKGIVDDLDGQDPLWKIRLAALKCSLGDFDGSRQAASAGLKELREHFYRNRDSVWITSRLAWAQLVVRVLVSWETQIKNEPMEESEVLQLRFLETKSDPWECLKAFDIKLEESWKKVAERKRTKEPLFEAGVYRDHSSTLRFETWWPTETIYEIGRAIDHIGIPPRAGHTNIMVSRMERAEILASYLYQEESDFLRVLRVAQDGGEELVKSVFSRIRVAVLTDAQRANLSRVLVRALEFALDQVVRREGRRDNFWSQRAAAYIEIISRLSVRLSNGEAIDLYRQALLHAQEPRWRTSELHKPLSNLLKRSLSAVAPSSVPPLVTETACFPLPDEVNIPAPFAQEWPEPSDWFRECATARPDPDIQFAERVLGLIDKVANGDTENRTRAARRLSWLHSAGALRPFEESQFGTALWARRKSTNNLPEDTTFYPHVFLILPSPDKELTRSILLDRSYEPADRDHLLSLSAAVISKTGDQPALILTKTEALKMLDAVLAWQPKPVPEFDLEQVRRENDDVRQAVGQLLADGILPQLDPQDLPPTLIQNCISLIQTGEIPSLAQALPELMRLQPSLIEEATKIILRMMVKRETDLASAGFHAAYRWAKTCCSGLVPPMPRRIVDLTVSTIELRREPTLFSALRNSVGLLNAGVLTAEDHGRLASAIESILIETNYPQQRPNEVETIAITLVRAAAVKLADCMVKHGTQDGRLTKIIDEAQRDPMPEVRFATSVCE